MTPLSYAVSDQKGKKNSPPRNQRDEEGIRASEKAPGLSNGWNRRHICRSDSSVVLLQCITSITLPGLFLTKSRIVLKLLEVYPLISQKSRKFASRQHSLYDGTLRGAFHLRQCARNKLSSFLEAST